MTESEALQLQLWCLNNLRANLVLKEREGDDWFVTVGLPSGGRQRLTGTVTLAATYNPNEPAPQRARLGLVSIRGQVFFKDGPKEKARLVRVHVSGLRDGVSPFVYETLEDRAVVVFS